MRNRGAVWLAGVVIVGATLLAYHNTFGVPFLFDDEPSILYNPTIKQLWPLSEPLSPPGKFGFTVSGRPLLNLSLAVNYAISGYHVWSYHVVNLIIHLGAGLALFGIARRTLRRPVLVSRFGEDTLPLALAVALLWTLHPLQTEAVTYIIQRAESLMGLFYLLTLYGFVRACEAARPWRWQVFTVVACALGMTCKEVMATAPVILLLYDRTFVSGSFRGAWRERRGFYGAVALTWLPLCWAVLQTGGNRGGTFELTWHACIEFWLTQFVAVTRYLWLAFCPFSLAFQYSVFHVQSLRQIWLEMGVIFTLLGATVWALWRRPVAGFSGAWFFLILSPSSLAPGITQITVEHRIYLSLAAIVAFVLGRIALWLPRGRVVAFGALALTAGILTERRNDVYRDDFTLWQDTVKKTPDSAKALTNLGTAYYRKGDYGQALAIYQDSLRRDPAPQTQFNVGLALDKLGRTDEAIPHYEEAVRVLPYFADAHAMLGTALRKKGKLPEAFDHLATALHYKPELSDTHYQLGCVVLEQGRYPEALASFAEALRLQPDFPEAECGAGMALFRLGRLPEAQAHLEQALKLAPNLADAHYNLGLVLMTSGNIEGAMGHYAEAVRFMPTLAEARLNWGIILAQSGRNAEALAQLQEAVRLKPTLAEAQGNLGIALAEAGRIEEAVGHYREALRLRPDYGIMHYNLGNALLRQRQWEEARSHFAEAVRLRPDFAPAQEMLDRLQTLPARNP